MEPSNDIHSLVDHLFRHESGKMVSSLSRVFGLQNLEVIQDIVQDTLIKAMQTWKPGSIPDNPTAWLYRVARNKSIDYFRKQQKIKEVAPDYAYTMVSDLGLSSALNNVFLEDEIADSQLRMMFVCCHPSIPIESQLALALKTLGGLSVDEIASAFLTENDTIAKRIYRARHKLRQQNIQMSVPSGQALHERLDAVLKAIYLLFNEGYHSANPDFHIREDLCQEAMRLNYLLLNNQSTAQSRVYALMSLMCFQASRFKARLDEQGRIILLAKQNRNEWYQPLIAKGFKYLQLSDQKFELSAYHLEATIASLHASAERFEDTNWTDIHKLYTSLLQLQPNPVVAMNKAIASRYVLGNEHALQALLKIQGLDKHPVYLMTLGELYAKINQSDKSKYYFNEARKHSASSAIHDLISQKVMVS